MAVRPSNFYYNISGQEAERLLLEYGSDNEFLARPSGSNPGDYTLSVKRGAKVTHMKMQNTGDFLDLYGCEMFATLAELVQHYMENPDQLRERDGDIITLKCPVAVPASESLARATVQPITERWFHNSLSGREAEKLLIDQGKNGSYLVRESQSTPGQYAISVRTEDKVTHIMVYSNNGRVDVGGGDTFESINELLGHYTRNPMVERSGIVVHLRAPLPSTRILAAGIDERLFQLQVTDVASGKDGFSEEFEKLQQLECCRLYSRKEGKRAENTAKNRYKHVLPYDHTRIKLLDSKPGQVGSDYINANLVEVLASDYPEFTGLQRSYISTQGCLPGTVDDFWRMVWQQNSRIIVMTTKEFERGRNKCVRYWPDAGSERRYGLKQELLVRNVSEVEAPEYMTRQFELSRLDDKGNPVETRSLYHWQFTVWPDQGCPSDLGTVLNFMEQVNACNEKDCPKDAGPIVVHGRTVEMVREQRSGMVETEQQYRFLYMAVNYHIDTIRKYFAYAQQGSGGEYMNIKDTTEQTCRQVTPTTPTHNSDHSTDFQPTPSNLIGEPHRLAPPPLPKRPPKHDVTNNDEPEHFTYVLQGSHRGYTDIKYTTSQTVEQVTQTMMPKHNSGHLTNLQPTPAVQPYFKVGSDIENNVDLRTLINLDQQVIEAIHLPGLPKKIGKIGQGASSSVHRYQMQNGTLIAGKKIRINLCNISPAETNRLESILNLALNEVSVLHSVNHENIIEFYGCFWDANRLVILMEHMPTSVRAKIPLQSEEECLNYSLQTANGLAYLHGLRPNAIVHRDIKCDNLLLNEFGIVKLTDFGLSFQLAIDSHSQSCLSTAPSTLSGTYFFMAPEVIQKMENPNAYGRKSDIWSLGCTIVEMLTGSPPLKKLGQTVFIQRTSKKEHWQQYSGNFLLPKASDTIQKLLDCMFIIDQEKRPAIDKVIALIERREAKPEPMPKPNPLRLLPPPLPKRPSKWPTSLNE